MRVTRHQHHKKNIFDYSLHNQILENVQLAKYLGITISDNMDWDQHISEISSKVTKTLSFLRRNLTFAPRSTKEVAYKTLVRPTLEYAAPIWSPYSKLQINQVEKVQRTTACWTCRWWRNTSSVGEMLNELQWPTLKACRDWSSLLLLHKIHSGSVSIEKDKYLTPAHSLKSTRASHSAQYRRYQTYSDALKDSFPPPPPPVIFHSGIVFLLRWSIPRLLSSLGNSSFSQKHNRYIFLVFFFVLFCFFSKIPNSQSLPLWSKSVPASMTRKKERKRSFVMCCLAHMIKWTCSSVSYQLWI